MKNLASPLIILLLVLISAVFATLRIVSASTPTVTSVGTQAVDIFFDELDENTQNTETQSGDAVFVSDSSWEVIKNTDESESVDLSILITNEQSIPIEGAEVRVSILEDTEEREQTLISDSEGFVIVSEDFLASVWSITITDIKGEGIYYKPALNSQRIWKGK